MSGTFDTIRWTDDGVVMIDQRRLPLEEVYLTCRDADEVIEAIRSMVIRGAPAIGVAAAMGLALGARQIAGGDDFRQRFEELCGRFAASRPTAVNLFWAIERMKRVVAANQGLDPAAIADRLREDALRVREEDIAANRRMGEHGAPLLPDSGNVLTHCNAGALATAGYGTALGVIRAAYDSGKKIAVLADETRPFLQGARLTAWELARDGIPVTVITDSSAGQFLRRGAVGAVVVGADRIAANGDVANKIGTYPLAVLARENNVPFYVAAPISTIDLEVPDGEQIPIEERNSDEVTHFHGRAVTPEGVPARNPAFDVTPNAYVTAIITDRGVARPPYTESLRTLAVGAPGSD
jgi:methylthioribose-1-phosphate isomerase